MCVCVSSRVCNVDIWYFVLLFVFLNLFIFLRPRHSLNLQFTDSISLTGQPPSPSSASVALGLDVYCCTLPFIWVPGLQPKILNVGILLTEPSFSS